MSETMRVRVVLTLEVDVAGWGAEYGVTRDNLREDVRNYIRNGLQDHFDSVGTPARVLPQ